MNRNYNRTVHRLFKSYWEGYKEYPPDSLGLEIECEGEKLYQTPLKWWRVEDDGSLRPVNGHRPAEYVLSKPIERSEVGPAIDYLLEGFIRAKSVISQNSPRTSVHVHMNCRDLTMKQVVAWVCLYLVVEDLLVDFAGPLRGGNLFCLRAKDAEHFLFVLKECIQDDSWSEIAGDNCRYTSCNMAALYKYGSLEFRALRGTTDKVLIEQWIDILRQIKSVALSMVDDPQAIDELLFETLAQRDPHKMAELILGPYYPLFQNNPNLRSWVWGGMRRVKDIIWAIPKWEVDSPTLSKKTFNNYAGLVDSNPFSFLSSPNESVSFPITQPLWTISPPGTPVEVAGLNDDEDYEEQTEDYDDDDDV